jgi:glycosyltransferase involved in cell wall biosynthesis
MSAIDVICPAWNAAATLAESLASVRAQTRPAHAIVVVDDGSTDGTATIARQSGAGVIHQDRGGPAAALNAGIAASTADLLAFIDADDLWPAHKLAVQADALGPHDAVFGMVDCFPCPSMTQAEAERYVVPQTPLPAWLSGAMLIRRAAFGAAGPFDPAMRGAFFIDWCDRARRRGLSLAMLPDIVLHRRIRPGSLSHRSPARDAGYIAAARAAIARRRTQAAE